MLFGWLSGRAWIRGDQHDVHSAAGVITMVPPKVNRQAAELA